MSRYQHDICGGKLGKAVTPAVSNWTVKQDDDETGIMVECCRRHVGGLWYLALGTRFDLMQALEVVARYLDKWCKRHDRMLHRIFEYLNGTTEYVHEMTVSDNDFKHFCLRTYVDADQGGCVETRRSTTGIISGIVGPSGTTAYIQPSAKRQGSAAPSTPHSETVAIAEGLRRVHLLALGTLEFAFRRRVPSEMLSDSAGAISSVRRGGTKGDLRYMAIYPGVSFGFSHDFFYGAPRSDNQELNDDQPPVDNLLKIPSGDNHADMFTKPLEPATFQYHARSIGICK